MEGLGTSLSRSAGTLDRGPRGAFPLLALVSSSAAALMGLWVGGLTLFVKTLVTSHTVGHKDI